MRSKKHYSKVLITLLFMMLQGCLFPVMWSNPGYMVSIEAQKIYKKDVVLFEDVLKEHNFNTSAKRGTSIICVWYKKDMSTGRRLEHPFVKTAVCYNEVPGTDMVKDFSFLIMNEWDGQDPELKQEIDSIADILIAELRKLVCTENITVERKATGPPF